MTANLGIAGLLAGILTAAGAAAETVVRLDRPVSDRDFHRAVACAADPGGPCRDALVRWSRRVRTDLRIALMPAEPGHPAATARGIDRALDAAIAEINAAGADLRLRRVAPEERPHLRLTPSGLREGQLTRGIDGFPDGIAIGAGQFQIWWNGDMMLERAAILIAADIAADEIRSVVLEEIVQSLGLWHDVEGPAYRGRSIFDNDSSSVARLTGQDAAILRLHYPP